MIMPSEGEIHVINTASGIKTGKYNVNSTFIDGRRQSGTIFREQQLWYIHGSDNTSIADK
ncbi:hypothetical protein R4E38_06175 [Morganella morganii]|uniref:hypothetical protein n=1 Tax=Morganella TaxID=581 RepID=UPI000278105E|nr:MULTISPECIES: hypothetical protein [Morganella]EFG2744580.1 hypothetical protein [Escherichia coli]AVH81445.1 hypothetical protein AL531_18855 [Morganella morganii]AZP24766.1 hypothetical protein D8758_04370 [Morganella morganii]EJD6109994.1 hypothetical protein [Morganella morganii]EJG2208135.1 hypothetical protein [Morganella morganii]